MIMIGTRSKRRGFAIDMSKSKDGSQIKHQLFNENSTLGKVSIHCIVIQVQSSFLASFLFLGAY